MCVFQDSITINGVCCSSPHTTHCSLLGNYRHFQSGQMSGVFKSEMITPLLFRQGICVAQIRIMGIYYSHKSPWTAPLDYGFSGNTEQIFEKGLGYLLLYTPQQIRHIVILYTKWFTIQQQLLCSNKECPSTLTSVIQTDSLLLPYRKYKQIPCRDC